MRRFSANYIHTVAGNPIRNGVVGVDEEGIIVEIIDHKGIEKEYAHTEFRNGIIVPGFVNAHCHTELSHLNKKVEPNTGLAGFVDQIRSHRLSGNQPNDKFIENAIIEMHRAGIVAVADICNTTESFYAKQNTRIHFINLIEVLGLEGEKALWITNKALATKLIADETLGTNNHLTPHSVYSLSSELLDMLSNEISNNYIVSIHFAESPDEEKFTVQRAGGLAENYASWGLSTQNAPNENPVAIVKKYLPRQAHTLFVHNTYLNNQQANELAQHFPNAYFVLCPASNIYIENALPDIPILTKTSVPIALGTDSLASSPTLSIFDQMQIITQHFPSIPFTEILKWGTMNGAKAIGLDDTLGTIELGKSPGLNLITPFDFSNNKPLPNSRVVKLI
jgi:cytosine/adenosine deaminase-related metal-dependent hydrolase